MPDTPTQEDDDRKTAAQQSSSSGASDPNPNAGATKEEPELRLEPSIPTDGKDEEGERLMEQLGHEREARKDAA